MKRQHLKAARMARGLTALALGELANVREEKIYAVERGRYLPTSAEATRWAESLGMPLNEAFPELFDTVLGDSEKRPTLSYTGVGNRQKSNEE